MKRNHSEKAGAEGGRRRIIFLRRGAVVAVVTALAAVGIFCAVLFFPASTAVSATERQLPIYCVETDAKRCAISFDAAWGDAKVR